MTREEQILGMISRTIQAHQVDLHGHRVILFGSRATGTAKPRSDFDIGVDGPTPLPQKVFDQLADEFEELPTLYSIDWVDLQKTSPQFRQQALQGAITLQEAEEGENSEGREEGK